MQPRSGKQGSPAVKVQRIRGYDPANQKTGETSRQLTIIVVKRACIQAKDEQRYRSYADKIGYR
jgi:hypothetical protein